MAGYNTPTKTNSAEGVSSMASPNSVNYSTLPITPSGDLLCTPVATPSKKAHSGLTTALGRATRSTQSPCRISKALSTSRVSPMRPRPHFHDAKLEIANIRITELREAKREFESTMAALRDENNKIKEATKAALAKKDSEIIVLKSNAWMDSFEMNQKDDEIAALRCYLDDQDEDSYEMEDETLHDEAQRLTLTIIDLTRVKQELMEEIQVLEIQKEALEFA